MPASRTVRVMECLELTYISLSERAYEHPVTAAHAIPYLAWRPAATYGQSHIPWPAGDISVRAVAAGDGKRHAYNHCQYNI